MKRLSASGLFIIFCLGLAAQVAVADGSTKELCILETVGGNTIEMISQYKNLDANDNSKLPDVLKAVHNENGKMDQVVVIATDQFYSPKTLYAMSAMEKSGCSKSFISCVIFNCASTGTFKRINIQELKADLIETLASNIRNNNYEQFEEFDENHGSILRDNLGELVRQSYANRLSNAETLIKFIQDLYSIESSIVGLDSLFDRMQNNGHLDSYQLVMLAYGVKELMEMPNYPKVDQKYKDLAENLKSKLPDNVRQLIWHGSRCTIKNKRHNEYLYAEGDGYKSNDYHSVFTWKPEDHPGYGANWKFVPYNNAEKFYIKSRKHDEEYIISMGGTSNSAGTADPYDAERRKIFTTEGKWSQSYWRIEPVENGQYFRIYSTYRNEYLYADGDERHAHDAKRRNVFTWRGSSMGYDHMQECKWEIDCSITSVWSEIESFFG
jgi:hypothetical protein